VAHELLTIANSRKDRTFPVKVLDIAWTTTTKLLFRLRRAIATISKIVAVWM
jgi:hypothetical protein